MREGETGGRAGPRGCATCAGGEPGAHPPGVVGPESTPTASVCPPTPSRTASAQSAAAQPVVSSPKVSLYRPWSAAAVRAIAGPPHSRQRFKTGLTSICSDHAHFADFVSRIEAAGGGSFGQQSVGTVHSPRWCAATCIRPERGGVIALASAPQGRRRAGSGSLLPAAGCCQRQFAAWNFCSRQFAQLRTGRPASSYTRRQSRLRGRHAGCRPARWSP